MTKSKDHVKLNSADSTNFAIPFNYGHTTNKVFLKESRSYKLQNQKVRCKKASGINNVKL